MVPHEHIAGGLMFPPLSTLQVLLLASWDCNRRGDARRAIGGRNTTIELQKYSQSKFSIAFTCHIFYPHTFDENISLKYLRYA